jgi:hypothetical protein
MELLNAVDRWMTGNLPRKNWVGRAHHMTNFPPGKFKQADMEKLPWGMEVHLKVTDWAADDLGIAVTVEPEEDVPFAADQVPHITVAHSFDVRPVYSNTLLADRSKWRLPHEPLTLMSYFVGFMQGDPSIVYPPMGSLLLASCSVPLKRD